MPSDPARNRRIREAAILAAAAYVATRIWKLEDGTAGRVRAEVAVVYGRLQAELINIFSAQQLDKWDASDPLFRQRTDALMADVYKEVKELTDTITTQALDGAIASYQASYYGAAWTLAAAARASVTNPPSLIPIEAIRQAILSPYQGNTFLDRFAQARDEFVMRIRRSIVESQIKGESIAQATRRLRDALGMTPGEATGYANRVEMIARTEILRSSNNAALEYYKANQDVLSRWEWKATNDERTCPICGALDGRTFTFDSSQEQPPGHPNCRCAALPVLADASIESAIVGPRRTYQDWARQNGITQYADGGILAA